jgi:hypothetical protein
MSDYHVIVGLRLDRPRTEYYVSFFPRGEDGKKFDSVRSMLTEHLDELNRQTTALHAILATTDPEEAERFLQDGVRLQVSELLLRPKLEKETLLPRLSAGFAGDPRL